MQNNNFISNIYVGKTNKDLMAFDEGDEYMYTFPKIEDIPTGYYLCEVVSVDESTTKDGKPGIDVCYDLYTYSKVYKNVIDYYINGIDEELNPEYHIRQRYVKDTDSFRKAQSVFKDTCVLRTVASWRDIVGCCYVGNLYSSYGDYCSLELLYEYCEEELVKEIEEKYL